MTNMLGAVKKQICRNFKKGKCKKSSEECRYSHADAADRGTAMPMLLTEVQPCRCC